MSVRNSRQCHMLRRDGAMIIASFFLCCGVVLSAQAATTTDPWLQYFQNSYLINGELPPSTQSGTLLPFKVMNWLPGQEFEILLPQMQAALTNQTVPSHLTPDYLTENIAKHIAQLQQPTAAEQQQTVDAAVTDHNLPIAVLNVWRPKTYITVKNLTSTTWPAGSISLLSSNQQGNLSFFRDPTWMTNRLITTNIATVPPEGTTTFRFLLDGRGPANHVYSQKYYLLFNDQPLHLNSKGALYWLTRVDPYQQL